MGCSPPSLYFLGAIDAYDFTYTPDHTGAQIISYMSVGIDQVGMIEAYRFTTSSDGSYLTIALATDVFVQKSGSSVYVGCKPTAEELNTSAIYHIRVHKRQF